jgi:GTP-binding protein
MIKTAEFIISAADLKQFPEDNLSEIAFVGRSNVGKSSLINKLVNRKNLAKTSSKPGKTRTINFYLINNLFRFVDLPGYGYAAVSKEIKNQWSKLIEDYLKNRKDLKAVIQLIDLRHEPTNLDIMMYDWLNHFNYPKIIVATKCDKLKKGKQIKQLNLAKRTLNLKQEDILIKFSALTGEGKEEILNRVKDLIS